MIDVLLEGQSLGPDAAEQRRIPLTYIGERDENSEHHHEGLGRHLREIPARPLTPAGGNALAARGTGEGPTPDEGGDIDIKELVDTARALGETIPLKSKRPRA